MATSQQVADGIRDLNVDWDNAEELHQILMHLHEIVQATQERLQLVADKLPETAIKPEYSDTISESAADLNGVADKIQSVVGGGVLQG
jgi:uncharacterized membrane protein YccC